MPNELTPIVLALRPREAAKAMSVCERTLHAWTKKNLVPHLRVGEGERQTILYPVAELQAWLSRQASRQITAGAKE